VTVSAEGAVGVASNPADLIRWILNNVREVRRELNHTRQTGITVKVNFDAVAAHQSGCVTVFSIQIVLNGLGNSVTTVVPVGIFNGNDHAVNASFHLRVPVAAMTNLEEGGLCGVRGVIEDDPAGNQIPIRVVLQYVLDGAAQREGTGSSPARMRRPTKSLSLPPLSAPSLCSLSLLPLSAPSLSYPN
jgi:hypothetical protein